MARPQSYHDNAFYLNHDAQPNHSSFIVPMIPSGSSSGQPSPLLGPNAHGNFPASLNSPSSVAQINLFGTSPSSTRGAYRHGGTAEQGEYRHAPSPATSYQTANSSHGHDDNQGLGIGMNHAPNYGAMLPPPANSSSRARQVGRMPSLGQLTGGSANSHSRHGSSGNGGLGRSLSISGITSILSGGSSGPPLGGSSKRGTSTNRLSYSPNPSAAEAGWGSSSDQTHSQSTYRGPSPSVSRTSPLPPQSGMMRRGLSYDAASSAAPAPGLYATPGRQAQLPPPPLATGGLLPYARQSGAGGYASPMSGVMSTGPTPSASAMAMAQAGTPNPVLNSPSQAGYGERLRNQSYSPSQYSAGASQTQFISPPQSSAQSSSTYATPAGSTASYYVHHIPPPQSSQPPGSAIPPPPLSSTYTGSAAPNTTQHAPPLPSLTPAHQPQAQQYYQSQQYYDSTLKPSQSGQSSSQAPASAYYSGAPPVRTPSAMAGAVGAGSGMKGFKRVTSTSEIKRIINPQPQGRRADPAGGFVSPIKALTVALPQTYRLINPAFKYETSLNPRRVLTKPSKPAGNDGFDNEDSDYILYVNDLLGPPDKEQYLILDVLGQGTFGQVVKCQNLVTHEIVAVKVVKNKPAYFQQSMMEVTILELINNQWDKDDEHHMLRLKDTFIHHSHLCLVFELLSNNLYELIKQNSFRGLSTSLVRVFTAQLLDAMTVLHEAKIIHCDLKPENILLKSLQSPSIKIIDFGSACHEKQTVSFAWCWFVVTRSNR